MLKRIKRRLALFLAMTLMLSTLTPTVWAAENGNAAADQAVVETETEAESGSNPETEAELPIEETPEEEFPEGETTVEEITVEEDTIEESLVGSTPGEQSTEAAPVESPAESVTEETEGVDEMIRAQSGVIASGECGEYTSWTLTNDGTLTIGGAGKMTSHPWSDYKSDIKKVVIKDGVTSIVNYAFLNCTSLTSVTIPDSVTSIGTSAFDGCTSLTDVYYTGSSADWANIDIDEENDCLTNATLHTDYQCSGIIASGACGDNLTWELTGDGTLTISGAGPMWNFSTTTGSPWSQYADQIITVVMEDGVTNIESCAFSSCTALTSVSIPGSVVSIGAEAFADCTSLTSVTIPSSVTSISEWTFGGCTSLTDVVLPDRLTSIGYCAFSCCTGLTSIVIPDSVTCIESGAFSGCDGLADAKGFIVVEGVLYGYIGEETEVVIPSNVTSIDNAVFIDLETAIISVTIPDSVSSIGEDTFAWCDTLTSITFEGDAPSMGDSMFAGVTATAYYPAGNNTWTAEVMQNYGGTINWEAYKVVGATITGTITSWEVAADADYYLYSADLSDAEIRADLASDSPALALAVGSGETASGGSGDSYQQSFTFDNVEAGEYKLVLYKSAKYVPRITTVTVGDGDIEITESLTIQPFGDVNGDGEVTTIDAARANAYARGTADLEDYALACADVSGGDGKVTTIDAARINAHARGTTLLW